MNPAAVLVWLVLEWGNAGGGLTPCPHGFIGGGLTPCVPAAPAVEFAGPTNAGMGAVCAGTVPTLTNGTPISFSRASAATCTKTSPSGIATTGIQNGDLVTLGNFQPRVEWATNGQLAYLGEPARTNNILWSEDFSNGVWQLNSSGVVVPVITANAAIAPDGNTTADRVDLPATTAGQFSFLFENPTTSAAATFSVYVRGVSASGTIDVCDNGGSTCVPCNFVSASWTRCTYTPASWTGISAVIGNSTVGNGGVSRPAQSVYIWGAQYEAGAFVSSYMPTSTAAVTRAADTAAMPATGSQFAQGSAAMSYVPEANGAVGIYPPQLSFTTTSRMLYGNSPSVGFFDGVNNPLTPAGLTAFVSKRYWSTWSTANGVTVRNVTDGNQATSAFSAGTWVTDGNIELQGIAGVWPSGLVYGICVDPSEARCR